MRISDWSSDVCSSDLLSILTSDASIRSSSDDSPLPMTSDRLSSSGAHGSWMSLSHRFTNQGFCELWTTKSTVIRSEEHTSELQSLMRISYAVFCLKKKRTNMMTPVSTTKQDCYSE